jgi:hypothetical protein
MKIRTQLFWFVSCTTRDEVKTKYRDLCKQHHPDRGGVLANMQAINCEYVEALRTVLQQDTTRSQADIDNEMDIEAVFMEKVQAISGVEGLIIELVGRWIWVTGNTYAVKDRLKQEGFMWAKKKVAWFWRSDDDKAPNTKEMSLEAIREKYGSRVVVSSSSLMLK